MNFIDAGYCKAEEYKAGEDSRLMPEELQIDEIYLLMVAIKSAYADRQALKNPVQLRREPTRFAPGVHIVRFAVLDADLRPADRVRGVFREGLWLHPRATVKNDPITSGYFKGYEEPLDTEFRQLGQSMSIASSSGTTVS